MSVNVFDVDSTFGNWIAWPILVLGLNSTTNEIGKNLAVILNHPIVDHTV